MILKLRQLSSLDFVTANEVALAVPLSNTILNMPALLGAQKWEKKCFDSSISGIFNDAPRSPSDIPRRKTRLESGESWASIQGPSAHASRSGLVEPKDFRLLGSQDLPLRSLRSNNFIDRGETTPVTYFFIRPFIGVISRGPPCINMLYMFMFSPFPPQKQVTDCEWPGKKTFVWSV